MATDTLVYRQSTTASLAVEKRLLSAPLVLRRLQDINTPTHTHTHAWVRHVWPADGSNRNFLWTGKLVQVTACSPGISTTTDFNI